MIPESLTRCLQQLQKRSKPCKAENRYHSVSRPPDERISAVTAIQEKLMRGKRTLKLDSIKKIGYVEINPVGKKE